MGLMDRLRAALAAGAPAGPGGAPNTPERWREDAEAWIEEWGPPSNMLVGESHNQKGIRRALELRAGERVFWPVNVRLERESGNPVDALAIVASVEGERVGYLRAVVANPVSVDWDDDPGAPGHFYVAGVARGGDGFEIGIHIWPGRRVSRGVELPDGWDWEVSWPPHDEEIECFVRDAATDS